MKNDKYWKMRFEKLQESLLQKGEDYYKSLDTVYNSTLDEINTLVLKWYIRFAKNNNLTLQEANKQLNAKELKELKWTLKEYIEKARESKLNGKWIKELENASAKVHIRRLEALELQLRQLIEELYQQQSTGIEETLGEIYKDGYYHSIYEIHKGLEVGSVMPALDNARVIKVLSQPWSADKIVFSSRIWKQKDELIQVLHTELTQNLILGNPPDKLIEKISKQFNTSKSKAGRVSHDRICFFCVRSTKGLL